MDVFRKKKLCINSLREEDAGTMREKFLIGFIGLSMAFGMTAAHAAPAANEPAGKGALPIASGEWEPDGKSAEVLDNAAGASQEGAPAETPEQPAQSGAEEPATSQGQVPAASETAQPAPQVRDTKAAMDTRKIIINIPSRSLSLYEGDRKIRLYPVAVGKPSTPTPSGYYKIWSKDVNPVWIDPEEPDDPKSVIPSGESNPLGYRWMEIWGNYGIHGTNRPNSIGGTVSNGCIRMHEEDVEELFDLVQLGTPVEIHYNRVIVEKTPEDIIAYYVYPDCYGWQSISVSQVNKWLAGYGIQCFESDEAIESKIKASDGKPTYIGRVFGIMLDGKTIPAKAVEQDQVLYLPAMEIAEAANLNLGWDSTRHMLISDYGEVKGYEKKDYLYFKAEDVYRLFHMNGAMRADKQYSLTSAGAFSASVPAGQQIPAPYAEPEAKETAASGHQVPPVSEPAPPVRQNGGEAVKADPAAGDKNGVMTAPDGNRSGSAAAVNGKSRQQEKIEKDPRAEAAAADFERPSSYLKNREDDRNRETAEKQEERVSSNEGTKPNGRTSASEKRPILRNIDLEDEED